MSKNIKCYSLTFCCFSNLTPQKLYQDLQSHSALNHSRYESPCQLTLRAQIAGHVDLCHQDIIHQYHPSYLIRTVGFEEEQTYIAGCNLSSDLSKKVRD